MNRLNLLRCAASALSVAAASSSLSAQAPATRPAPPEETVVLRPFEVTAEKSTGYKVSTASTATRTNTAIIDIPQSVDIAAFFSQ